MHFLTVHNSSGALSKKGDAHIRQRSNNIRRRFTTCLAYILHRRRHLVACLCTTNIGAATPPQSYQCTLLGKCTPTKHWYFAGETFQSLCLAQLYEVKSRTRLAWNAGESNYAA